MYPQVYKIQILNRIRPVSRILFGKLNKEFTDAKRKSEWANVLQYCKEIDAPEIKSVQDIKNKFTRWKQSLSQKIDRKSQTGAPRGDDLDESEIIITAIIKENPCLQKSQVCTFYIVIQGLH